ncbi:hypothetical protein H5410_044598 [Solanum commersonii]|uniref:ATP-dependent DNA helicase n=1 Tax=Solanum commersonii TaxID=4109 RepID=A0A9J5XAD6_SOLCO|nr:hypothetical protein H5410_044598 [Solanum commersonii]
MKTLRRKILKQFQMLQKMISSMSEEDILLQRKLNVQQNRAYHIILERVYSNKSGAFFIDGPGCIALATASSAVTTSILPGGRTSHSCLKITIDIDENFTWNISKQSSLATLIRDSKLIVWDEVSMAKKTRLKLLIHF